MRTLHVGLRVADRERSVAFYEAIGYEVVGEVPATGLGHLTMLKLPAEDVVSIELVSDPPDGPVDPGSGPSHVVIAVDDLAATAARLAAVRIEADAAAAPDDPDGLRTAWITDPDGTRIELVQWPAGHPDGLTAADFT